MEGGKDSSLSLQPPSFAAGSGPPLGFLARRWPPVPAKSPFLTGRCAKVQPGELGGAARAPRPPTLHTRSQTYSLSVYVALTV